MENDPKVIIPSSQTLNYLTKESVVIKDEHKIKILSADMTPYLQEEFGFIDHEFPHHYSSVTGTDSEDVDTVEWVPAETIQPLTNYSTELGTIQANMFYKKAIGQALVLVNLLTKDIIPQLLERDISTFNMYSFEVIVDGVFMNIAIDSYIPVHSHNKKEIFTKNYKGSIFPCLYQKLLAKIYGDYYSISGEFIDIVELQTMFCRQEISTTQGLTISLLKQLISIKLQGNSVVSFRTRNSIHLEALGLQSNHVYVILRLIQRESGDIVQFLQMEGEQWIGKMSKLRSEWLLEESSFTKNNKIVLGSQCRQNYMRISDLKGISRELIVLNNTTNYHKNYYSCNQNSKHITMYTFSLEENNHLMIRLNYRHRKCYNSVMLVEENTLIKAQFRQNKESNFIEATLQKGKYFLVVYNSHPQQKNIPYTITIFSSAHFVQLESQGNIVSALNLMEKTFQHYLQQFIQSSPAPVIFKHLYSLTGLAFIYASPFQTSLQITINPQKLSQSKIFGLNLPALISEQKLIQKVQKDLKRVFMFRCLWSRQQNIAFDYQTKSEVQKMVFPPLGSVTVRSSS